MRLLILSDVHANLPALDAVLYKERGKYDRILFLGDAVGYGPHPDEVVEALRNNVVGVMGNHDWAVLEGDTSWFNPYAAWAIDWTRKNMKAENVHWLRGLKKGQKLLIDGKIIKIVHGSPRDPLFEYIFPDTPEPVLRSFLQDCDVLLLGHTHIPFAYTWRKKWIINPGSVGQPRDGDPRAAYVVMDTEDWSFRLKRVEYDVDRTVEDMKRKGFPVALWRRLYYGL